MVAPVVAVVVILEATFLRAVEGPVVRRYWFNALYP